MENEVDCCDNTDLLNKIKKLTECLKEIAFYPCIYEIVGRSTEDCHCASCFANKVLLQLE